MKRTVSSIAAVLMVLAAVSLSATAGAGAATTAVPSFTISPSTGLTNGQSVAISGTGFTPNESLVAVECASGATSSAGCNSTSLDPITVSATGSLTSSFDVATGTIGNGSCGTSATNATCVISIATTSGVLVTFTSFSFATGPGLSLTPSTNLTNGEAVSISGVDFTPGDSVFAVECLATAVTEASCDTSTAQPITVSSTGTLPATSFKVVTGAIGDGTCGTSVKNYDGCIIEVANITGADKSFASIDFVAPKVTAAAPKATRVVGSAIPGRTVDLTIDGTNFTAGPTVRGHAGTVLSVLTHSSSKIVVKARTATSAKAGKYTLSITFASGKKTTVVYTVK